MSSWTLRDLLLKGAPWEVLPDDLPKVESAARRYAKDSTLSKAHRDYISRVWLPPEAPEPEPLTLVLSTGGDHNDPDRGPVRTTSVIEGPVRDGPRPNPLWVEPGELAR